jgi:hypothetical protein
MFAKISFLYLVALASAGIGLFVWAGTTNPYRGADFTGTHIETGLHMMLIAAIPIGVWFLYHIVRILIGTYRSL